ncbi:MAG: universal stress protein [Acidimicrobiales bacterium]
MLHGRNVTLELRPETAVVDAICEEAKLGYGAIVVGVAAESVVDGIPEWVSRVIAATNVPVVIIRRPKNSDRRTPWAFGRALVPIAGGSRARAAQEVAFGISAAIGTEVVLARVRTPVRNDAGDGGRRIASKLLSEASDQARHTGARVQTLERAGDSAPDEILNMAKDVAADLVVLGVGRKSIGGEPYLGSTATEILANCDCTVIAIVLSDGLR